MILDRQTVGAESRLLMRTNFSKRGFFPGGRMKIHDGIIVPGFVILARQIIDAKTRLSMRTNISKGGFFSGNRMKIHDGIMWARGVIGCSTGCSTINHHQGGGES
jgi:hypothetical protein